MSTWNKGLINSLLFVYYTKNFHFLFFILILVSTISCESNSQSSQTTSLDSPSVSVKTNEFSEKYSGGYTVELTDVFSNDETEVYILKNNGTAKWMYVKNDGNGGVTVEYESLGTWIASETNIAITCESKTDGLATEEFKLKNGRFYDTLTGSRYLKLNQ